jgi:hypothetical protein
MVGVLLFLVIAGLAVRVVYGLRPQFWLFSAVVVLVVLPLVVAMAMIRI